MHGIIPCLTVRPSPGLFLIPRRRETQKLSVHRIGQATYPGE